MPEVEYANKCFNYLESNGTLENSLLEKTADAPLGGASPPRIESASEQEESPTAMDCTSLTLVDAVQNESAMFAGENKDCGDEQKGCFEDTCSAAPSARNQKSATVLEEQIEQSQLASLMAKNQVSGEEPKTDHEGTSSAPPIPQPEKAENAVLGFAQVEQFSKRWSSEAIAARSKARPWRVEKLKMAGIVREKLDFEFLVECWDDDPALQIVIKKLLAKFPQWGIACVDGVLLKWDE